LNGDKKKPKLTRVLSTDNSLKDKSTLIAADGEKDGKLSDIAHRKVIKRKKAHRRRFEEGKDIAVVSTIDRPFLILVLILLCIGTVMVFSASYAYAKANQDGDSYHFAREQLRWVGLAIVFLIGISQVKYTLYERFAPFLAASSLIVLAIVPIVGYEANGAKRWINLGFSFQPSEFVKIGVVLFIAWYAVKYAHNMQSFFKGLVFVMIFVGIADIFLFLQPHLSAMIIITALAFVMLFLGGARPLHLGGSLIAGALAIGAMVLFTDHGRSRIAVWLNPEKYLQNAGWQPYQSKLAIGSGGLWGVGLGQSRQKHLYLPEPQNDYIFAILCEELGFIFAAIVIILFLLLIWRGYYIARNAPRRFPALVAMGLTTHIAIQVFLNIAVVTNAIPATGVSLPFFSYGGTALVAQMIEMGIILNISKYSYIDRN